MREQIKYFIRACDTCQRHKNLTTSPAGAITTFICSWLYLERYLNGFHHFTATITGKDYYFGGCLQVFKICSFHTYEPSLYDSNCGSAIFNHIFKQHGLPRSIVSDRDAVFLSSFWQELFKLQRVTFKTLSAYHPESDGQSQVVNWRCIWGVSQVASLRNGVSGYHGQNTAIIQVTNLQSRWLLTRLFLEDHLSPFCHTHHKFSPLPNVN